MEKLARSTIFCKRQTAKGQPAASGLRATCKSLKLSFAGSLGKKKPRGKIVRPFLYLTMESKTQQLSIFCYYNSCCAYESARTQYVSAWVHTERRKRRVQTVRTLQGLFFASNNSDSFFFGFRMSLALYDYKASRRRQTSGAKSLV